MSDNKVAISSNGPAYRLYRFPHPIDGETCYLVPDGTPVYDAMSALCRSDYSWWEEPLIEQGRANPHPRMATRYIVTLIANLRLLDKAIRRAKWDGELIVIEALKNRRTSLEYELQSALNGAIDGVRPQHMPPAEKCS